MHDPDGPTPKPASTWGNAAGAALHNVCYGTAEMSSRRLVGLLGVPSSVLHRDETAFNPSLGRNRVRAGYSLVSAGNEQPIKASLRNRTWRTYD